MSEKAHIKITMSYVAKITIDKTKVPSNLTDFPIYVNLSHMPSSFWNVVADGGGDIRCYKSDGTTELPREVVSCVQASDTGELYIKYTGTLSSSVDTEIQIHADGSSSDYAVTDTYGRNNVWKSGYKAVLHHQSDGTDSSGNGDWSPAGSPSYSAVVPGQGVDISASTKWMTRNNDGGLTRSAPMTMSSVQKFKAVATNAQSVMCWGDYTQSFYYEMRYENSGGWKLCSIKQTGSEIRNDVAYTAQSTNPTHLAMRFDGTNLVHYADMTQIGTQAPSAGSSSNSFMDNMSVGAIPHGSGYMQNFWGNNIATETRFYLGDLGVDWLTAEKNNLLSASTFYTAVAGAVNVNPTATVLAATFSIVSPSVSTTRNPTVSATTLSAVFSIPTPTITTIRTVSVAATTLSAVFSIPTPTVTAGVSVVMSPTTLSAVFSMPTPAISAGGNVSVLASTLVATFSIPTPTISPISNISVAATTLQLTITAVSPAVSGAASPSGAVLELTFSIISPSISAIRNLSFAATVLAATFSLPSVVVSSTINFNAVTSTLTFSLIPPTVTAIANLIVPASTLSMLFSLPEFQGGGVWRKQPQVTDEWTKTAITE